MWYDTQEKYETMKEPFFMEGNKKEEKKTDKKSLEQNALVPN